MSARRRYQDYVLDDLDRIEVRAITLYALSDPAIPWPLAGSEIHDPFKDRAAVELWQEGALHLDPNHPYYAPE